ncbi:uncharacterized protein LOC126830134 [Patella vulgata]|uniref:uncharacterized protein LOC126830134 n=1 Tax=Patella vulgata TaxID=6465 RepID=UPI00217FEC4C|nr:uncharacterized protein LOC126830134 [Patella vulgata]
MDGKSILLMALIYAAVIQDVKAAKLTIQPSQNIQAGSTYYLALQCSPDSNSSYTKLRTMEIYKQSMVSPKKLLVKVDSTGSYTPGAGITKPKYKILFLLNAPQLIDKYVQVDINNPDCHDTAEYTCETTGETATSSHPVYLKDSKTVTVQSNPGKVEMKIFHEKPKYDVGEKIEITCQTGVENPEPTWTWEFKPSGDSLTDVKFYKVHDTTYDVRTENIRKSQVDQHTSTQCGYNTGSTLQHEVGMEDDGLKIRCMVDNSELYSAIKTIYLTLDDVKKRMLLADTERIKLEQEKLKQQISKNTTNCNCCCN